MMETIYLKSEPSCENSLDDNFFTEEEIKVGKI